jgi:hypothetical protein
LKTIDYNKLIIEKIDAYLAGNITYDEVSSWAEEMLCQEHFETQPKAIVESVHALFDLHDKDEQWSPTREELLSYRERLLSSHQP